MNLTTASARISFNDISKTWRKDFDKQMVKYHAVPNKVHVEHVFYNSIIMEKSATIYHLK